jgi:hypothetical protein
MAILGGIEAARYPDALMGRHEPPFWKVVPLTLDVSERQWQLCRPAAVEHHDLTGQET